MTTSNSEWQRVVKQMKTNKNEWNQYYWVILGFKIKQQANLVPE